MHRVLCLMIVRRHKADDSNKDMPKSGSGSHVKPILEHLYHENPKYLNAETCAFGDGVTAIMQGGGGIAKEKSCSNVSDFRLLQHGGGQQLTLLSRYQTTFLFYTFLQN